MGLNMNNSNLRERKRANNIFIRDENINLEYNLTMIVLKVKVMVSPGGWCILVIKRANSGGRVFMPLILFIVITN
jgi:hypothetical protein